MKQLFETAKQQLEAKKDLVLVSVIASFGSAPRGAGARMLVTEKGRIYGTIGGGAVEYESTKLAAEALKQKESRIQNFRLARNPMADIGMTCGGNVTISFQYVSHTDLEFKNFANHIIHLYDRSEPSWLLTDLSEKHLGAMGVYGVQSGLFGIEGNEQDLKDALIHHVQPIVLSGHNYYAEELVHPGIVYVFGGGHVAQKLVPVLSHVGFRCTVADDRPEYSSPELFPDAERTILIDFNHIEKEILLTPDDAVCIMTRGHAYDTEVLLQVIQKPVRYIGLMGSRSKIAGVSKILRENGVSEEKISRVHMPIGLAIRAETPAEIAISIAAELIQERAAQHENKEKHFHEQGSKIV